VTTYTLGMTAGDLAHEPNPDDLGYARQVAAELGVECHERILSPEIVDLLPKLVWHLDDPVADPATINTYLICAAARERMTVILGGMGGDEIFAGYPRYTAARIGRMARHLPQPLRTRLRTALEGRLTLGPPGRLRGPRRNLMKLIRGIDQDLVPRHLTYTSYYREHELPGLLSGETRAALSGHDPFQRHLEFAERKSDADWLNQLLYVDMKTYMSGLNLSYTDKMSMAASTEVRVPLLDDEVVALSGRIPPELKLHGSKRKYVLKRSMEGILPDEVIWRPKAGFSAPIRAWLTGPLRPMVDDLLGPETIRARGLFDPGGVASMIDDNTRGTADNALRIWALLVLELWQQRFMDGDSGQARVAA
jgi:asparagine synthase (glutamine-hydrolysing)